MQSQEIGRIYVKVTPDLTGFASDVLEDIKTIEKELPSVGIFAELDKSSAAQVRSDLEGLTRSLDAEINPSLDRTATEKVRAELSILFHQKHVLIKPKLDKKAVAKALGELTAAFSGAKFIRSFLKPITTLIKNLATTAVPIIGLITLAFNLLTAGILLSGAALAVLASDLALIAPAALALPGIFGGLAIGVGLSVIAFTDFNKVLPDVVDKFSSLKSIISDNFWAGAEEPIRNMVNTLFPQILTGVTNVSTALGDFFGSFADGLSDAFDDGVLQAMFTNLTLSIKFFSGATDNLANIIATLGIVGSQYLPKLATWFKGLLTSFDGFLQRSLDSGDIFDWIDTGLANLRALGDVFLGIGRIIGGLATAARDAGVGGIQALADGLNGMADAINTPAFQTGLTTVLRESLRLFDIIGNIAGPSASDTIGNFATLAQQLFPKVGVAVGYLFKIIFDTFNNPLFQEGFALFVEGMSRGLRALDGASGPLASILGALHKSMAAIAVSAGPLLVAALEAIDAIIGPMGDTIAGLFLFGFQALTETIQMLTPLLPPIATAFNNLLLQIRPLAETILPIFRAGLTVIAEHLPGIISSFGGLLASLGALIAYIQPVVIPVLQFLWDMILGAIQGVISGLTDMVTGFTTILTNIVDLVKNVFSGQWGEAWQNIKNILSGVLDLIWGAIQVWWNGSILAFFKGGFLKLLGLFKGSWKSIFTTVKNFLNLIVSGVKGFVSGVFNFFKNLGANLKGSVTSTGTSIKQGFETALNYVINLVITWIAGIWNFFKTLGLNIIGEVSKFWTTVKTSFKNSMNTAKDTISNTGKKIIQWFKDLPGNIVSALGNMGTVLIQAGSNIIDGFIDGITAGFDRVKGTLGKLTSWLPDWKGPASRDKKILQRPGELVISGFIESLESGYDEVKKSLRSLTDLVEGTKMRAPSIENMSIPHSTLVASMAGAAGFGKTINYYAYGDRGLSSEEELFNALGRGRGDV